MKTDFQFSNLLGTVYRKGNVIFTPDGTCLLSPVGNRVTVFDLTKDISYTLPVAHRRNISRVALNPRGNLLLTIDDDGRAILTNFVRRVILYHLSFKAKVGAVAFSPSGTHFAVGVGRFIEVWHTPSTPDADADGQLEFAPFVRHHVHAGHSDTVKSVSWSSDSRFFLTSSKDLTARVWSLDQEDGFQPTTLTGHKKEVKAAWFSDDQETIYTVSKDGALFDWKYRGRSSTDENDADLDQDPCSLRWRVTQRHYFHQNQVALTCAAYHPSSNLLVTGFSSGIFTLHVLPDFSLIHTLSISQSHISNVTINTTGEWLAFGSSTHGQLLVWEWQSESYILKQQGHLDATNALAYSPDGNRLVTGSDDGKLKLWDTQSGFCIVTFPEHTSGITGCAFSPNRSTVLFTSSLDGSIRAWDLLRYRNFRVFTAPTRLPFTCLAVDPSAEVVAAGSTDSFDIHIWSVQTGQLLDTLAGHEGPVSTLAFSPSGSSLCSGSWDHTVRIWDIFSRTQTSEPLQLQADVLSLTCRPDSKQLAIATLDGALTFWDLHTSTQISGLDARRDVSGGRKPSDRRTAASAADTKNFTTLTYSADGAVLLAAGNSKNVCLYAVASAVLLRKYTVSINLDLAGTQEYLNSRALTEAGPQSLLSDPEASSDSDGAAMASRARRTVLPGAKKGQRGERATEPVIRVPCVAFSPTNRSFCAASTEGLLIYSLDATPAHLRYTFDPIALDVDVTPANALAALNPKASAGHERDPLKALVMSLRLNDARLLGYIYTCITIPEISLVVRALPAVYLPQILRHAAVQLDEGPHLEFGLRWVEALLRIRGRELRDSKGVAGPELRLAQRAVRRVQRDLGRVADENGFRVDYLLGRPTRANGMHLGDGKDGEQELTMQDLIDGVRGVDQERKAENEADMKAIDLMTTTAGSIVTNGNGAVATKQEIADDVDMGGDSSGEAEGEWIGLDD